LRLDILKIINRNFVSRRVSTELHAYNVTASVIYDLLCVKSHQAELSILSAADIDLIVVCVVVQFFVNLFFLVFCVFAFTISL